MRPAPCLIFAALALSAVGLYALASRADTPRPPAPAAPAAVAPAPGPASPQVDHPEKGYGKTKEDAHAMAGEHARAWVVQYLADHHTGGDLGWEPSLPFLEEKGAVQYDPVKETTGIDGETAYEATAHVRLTADHLREMQEEVRKVQEKAKEGVVRQREFLAGLVLAGLVVVLLVVASYIKLEEATRGYYTLLLRLAAGGVVLLTVVGLTLLFRAY
jgi:hypothetical protein